MNPVLIAGVVSGLALVLTAAFTPVVRGVALSGGMVRGVQDDRWHKRPTPAIGGIAIYLGFGLAVGAGYLLAPETVLAFVERPVHAVLPWSPWEGLVLASSLAFVVGLVDDFLHLRPLAKLAGQLVAAGVLLLSGIGVWLTGVYAVDAALSMLWFVGITNAINLLDNMDGLAAGISAIAAAYLALLFYLDGVVGLAILALGFSAALLGFLAHNYPPARIFMGDSGSLFLGLFLAGLALAPAPGLSRSLAAVMAAPVLILGVPILDTTLVTLGRLLEGRPVSQGGKDHTSHRLVDLGMPEERTVWLLWGLATVGGGVGLLLRSADRGGALLMGGVLIGAITLVGAYLLAVRFRSLADDDLQGLSAYRFLIRSQERYPVFAMLLDGVWFVLAYWAAYLIRWEPAELPGELPYFQGTVTVWVGVKLLAFALTGIYSTRWPSFGLFDGVRVARASFAASVVTVAVVLVVDRVGLSRGVVAIDFLVATFFVVGARLSFRLLEGTTQRWSSSGRSAVLCGFVDDLEGTAERMIRLAGSDLRVVALASPTTAQRRSRLGRHTLYGGTSALHDALEETGAHAIVVVGEGDATEEHVRGYLERRGGVDVYRLNVSIESMDPGAETSWK